MNQQGMGDLFKQVTRMRKDIEVKKDELKERYVEASAGNDAVEVVFNGQQELVKLSIDPSLVRPDAEGKVDIEMLEDLVVAAVSMGLEKSKELESEEMNSATGGLTENFPGLF